MLAQKLQDFIVSKLIKMDFLDGYRMYAGGAFFILTGLGTLANQFAGGEYDAATFQKGVLMIGSGLAIIGKAGKDDKSLAALKEGK